MLTRMRNMTSKFTSAYSFHISICVMTYLKKKMNYSVPLEHKIKQHKLNSNQKNHLMFIGPCIILIVE